MGACVCIRNRCAPSPPRKCGVRATSAWRSGLRPAPLASLQWECFSRCLIASLNPICLTLCQRRDVMRNTVANVLVIASVLTPVAGFAAPAPKAPPATATYIMKEELDKIGATEQSASTRDENAKVVDLGYE